MRAERFVMQMYNPIQTFRINISNNVFAYILYGVSYYHRIIRSLMNHHAAVVIKNVQNRYYNIYWIYGNSVFFLYGLDTRHGYSGYVIVC
jgi:hypothetical protein